ncbi:MAG: CsbD family protein, partial [Burkholderiaceae bacterium]
MNKYQVKGRVKEAAGEVQEQVGKVTGNKSQELKGHAKEF